jgi:Fe-S-cluster containining protein
LSAELDVRREQRVYTAERLRHARTPLQVIEVTRHAGALADQAVRVAMKEVPARRPPACREGCAWCCYKPVGTAAPEVLRIVAYLRDNLSPEQWQSLCERVRLADERWRHNRRAARPCPLLVEDRCSAYPVRPLTCRGYNSSDARRCKDALDSHREADVPVYEPQQRLATFVLDGLRAGVAENALEETLLELTPALRIALERPDAEQGWLAGERLFAAARLD